MHPARFTVFHAPQSRSTGVVILAEELGADYDVHLVNMKAGEQRSAEYMAVNPMGKVPAVKHGDAVITEQVAIYLYLADLYPEAKMAPSLTDARRGPYLRWMAFYGSCFEPAAIDRALKREPAPQGMSPYGDFDTMLGVLTAQLSRGDFILGDEFCSADVLWGTSLKWMLGFGLLPPSPVFSTYAQRIAARPVVMRVTALDAERAAAQAG